MNAARAVVSVLLLGAGAMILAGPLGATDCLRPVGELPEGPSLAVDMEDSLAAFGRGRVLLLDATECAFPPPRHPSAGRLVPGSGVDPDP